MVVKKERREFGTFGEEEAERLLMKKGYKILAKNWSCRYGEIDIIARRGNNLVFVEVKARRQLRFGRPAESVTDTKINHIKNAAMAYIKSKKLFNMNVRFDVIEVYFNHMEGVF